MRAAASTRESRRLRAPRSQLLGRRRRTSCAAADPAARTSCVTHGTARHGTRTHARTGTRVDTHADARTRTGPHGRSQYHEERTAAGGRGAVGCGGVGGRREDERSRHRVRGESERVEKNKPDRHTQSSYSITRGTNAARANAHGQ